MRIKVRLTVTVEIDPQAWADEYGMDAKAVPAIQEDVRDHIVNAIQQMPVAPVAVTKH